MKKWICRMLTMVMLLGLCPAAMTEEAPVYQLGDKVEDFSLTLSDGTEVSLYGLLSEKKAVLINLWASWCGPCKREFPFMQQAYDAYSQDIGILALSAEPNDTDEILLALRADFGITTIPVGLDTAKLADRFGLAAYPTSVLVDQNGVVCLVHVGSVPDLASFERLFDVFIAEDYEEPVLLTKLPPDPGPEKRPAEELRAALGIAGEQIAVQNAEEEGVWPFYASQDGSFVRATNDGLQDGTISAFVATVTAQAGQALAYDYTVSGQAFYDALHVYVDGEPVKFHSGELDGRTGFVAFEEAGEHTAEFRFKRYKAFLGAADAGANIANLRVINAEAAAALQAAEPEYPKSLEGADFQVEVIEGELKQARIYDADGNVKETVDVLQTDGFTQRFRIGKDVDPTLAFVQCDGVYHMLSNLPYDGEGFLLRHARTEALNDKLPPYHFLSTFVDAFDEREKAGNFVGWFHSEGELDAYVTYMTEYYAQREQKAVELAWAYVDGTPKQGEAREDAPAEGMGRYAFTVQDESGAPVAGVTLQICDDSTCALVVTDENGTATHEAACSPYEIHVLRAPADYAAHTQIYTMPEAGGSLVITLQKP